MEFREPRGEFPNTPERDVRASWMALRRGLPPFPLTHPLESFTNSLRGRERSISVLPREVFVARIEHYGWQPVEIDVRSLIDRIRLSNELMA